MTDKAYLLTYNGRVLYFETEALAKAHCENKRLGVEQKKGRWVWSTQGDKGVLYGTSPEFHLPGWFRTWMTVVITKLPMEATDMGNDNSEKSNIEFAVRGWLALNGVVLDPKGSYDFQPDQANGVGYDIVHTDDQNNTKIVGCLTDALVKGYLRWGAVLRARMCVLDIQRAAADPAGHPDFFLSISDMGRYLEKLIADFEIKGKELFVP